VLKFVVVLDHSEVHYVFASRRADGGWMVATQRVFQDKIDLEIEYRVKVYHISKAGELAVTNTLRYVFQCPFCSLGSSFTFCDCPTSYRREFLPILTPRQPTLEGLNDLFLGLGPVRLNVTSTTLVPGVAPLTQKLVASMSASRPTSASYDIIRSNLLLIERARKIPWAVTPGSPGSSQKVSGSAQKISGGPGSRANAGLTAEKRGGSRIAQSPETPRSVQTLEAVLGEISSPPLKGEVPCRATPIERNTPVFPQAIITATDFDGDNSTPLEPENDPAKTPWNMPANCPACAKHFRRRIDMDHHMRTSHSAERAHACGQCESSFKLAHHLKQHVISAHSKLEKEHCPHALCTYKSSRRGDMNRHVRTKHRTAGSPQ